ncbi:MAG: NfeD family protein, partial [Pseudomonadota bacterium]
MDLSAPTLWWVLAGVLVAVELATGTFYLLMSALGAAGAAARAIIRREKVPVGSATAPRPPASPHPRGGGGRSLAA